ncbi:MAG: vWA domain-containing protein [Planctomycetota bacterium]
MRTPNGTTGVVVFALLCFGISTLHSTFFSAASAQSTSDGPIGSARRPLDLPSGGNGSDDDEEDEPEAVTYYGAEIEGDGFFWCLDRSCSMGEGASFTTLKVETTRAIMQLSRNAEFAVVFYSSNLTVWPVNETPARATPGSKNAAVLWVNLTPYQGQTCMGAGVVKVCEIANQSTKRRRQVLMLGDGVPFCDGGPSSPSEVLDAVETANYQHIPFNTFYISDDASGIQLFQDIAGQTGGTFTLVD